MSRWTIRTVAFAGVIAVAPVLFSGLLSGAANAQAGKVRVGDAARLPLFTAREHPLRAGRRLEFSVALKPRDPAALKRYATAVSTPGNPAYGHFLTVRQFADRFGARETAASAVSNTLRGEGLSVSKVTANNLMLTVSGTVGTIDDAMQAQVSAVTLPSGRHAFANLAAPAFSPKIAPYIQGVLGLDDVAVDKPAGLTRGAPSAGRRPRMLPARGVRRKERAAAGPVPTCTFAPQSNGLNGEQTGYSYNELATAYGINSLYAAGDEGQGQTIALLEAQPYSASDIETFQSCYGTHATVTPVNVDGGPTGDNCAAGSTTCDDGESALDIETLIGIAPRASIIVYQSPPANGNGALLNQIVSDDKAQVISSSLGLCEANATPATVKSENTLLMEAAAQGQSFFQASGDSGSEACSASGMGQRGFSENLAVLEQAAQPFATAVGGTTFFVVDNGDLAFDDRALFPRAEVVWNNGPNASCGCSSIDGGASGGGISDDFAMPSYQSSAPAALGVTNVESSGTAFCGQATCREVPDVSADAAALSGYIVFSSSGGAGGWTVQGGTSAAAPLWAAYMALVNAQTACKGKPIGFANPALYSAAASAYGTDFFDIQPNDGVAELIADSIGQSSSDTNDNLVTFGVTGGNNTSALYRVTPGYDMATGLGSMEGGPLAASLCALRAAAAPISVQNPGSQESGTVLPVSLQISATDSAAGATPSYAATGLPEGLKISSTGLITGTPKKPGSSMVKVSVTDQFANTGTAEFAWKVVKPKRPTAKLALSGVKKGRAALKLKLAAGAFNAPLTAVRVSLPKGLSFAKRAKALKKGTTVEAGKKKQAIAAHVKAKRESLTVTFKAHRAVAVIVARPAIKESGALKRSAAGRKAKKHGRRRAVKLKVKIELKNFAGATRDLAHTFKP